MWLCMFAIHHPVCAGGIATPPNWVQSLDLGSDVSNVKNRPIEECPQKCHRIYRTLPVFEEASPKLFLIVTVRLDFRTSKNPGRSFLIFEEARSLWRHCHQWLSSFTWSNFVLHSHRSRKLLFPEASVPRKVNPFQDFTFGSWPSKSKKTTGMFRKHALVGLLNLLRIPNGVAMVSSDRPLELLAKVPAWVEFWSQKQDLFPKSSNRASYMWIFRVSFQIHSYNDGAENRRHKNLSADWKWEIPSSSSMRDKQPCTKSKKKHRHRHSREPIIILKVRIMSE
jgi:hypothetical protein